MKLRDKLLIIFGIPAVIFTGMWLMIDPCYRNSSMRCKSPEVDMQVELSGTRPYAEIRKISGLSLDGFCEDGDIKILLDAIPKQFTVECKDTEDSYTAMAKDFKKPERSGWCADGKGNFIATELTSQNGVECK